MQRTPNPSGKGCNPSMPASATHAFHSWLKSMFISRMWLARDSFENTAKYGGPHKSKQSNS
eukprot:5257878-Amphidinium_carterae.2